MKVAMETLYPRLLEVQRPAAYLGGERNAVVKPEAQLRMAVCYPDLYEVGMANNGIKILYDRVNTLEGVACERVFAVAPDMERLLREKDVPLYTLETREALFALDILAFNMAHELLYTGMLQVLDLGRIPLRRTDRGEKAPLVLGGGAALSSPAAAYPFLDAIFLGDGEEGILEIARLLLENRERPREERLGLLGAIPGVLVPGLRDYRAEPVKRRIYRGKLPDPQRPLVPNIRISQDRGVVELSRGCPNLCRFCHAGYYELPCRENPVHELEERIFRIIKSTGYEEVTLSALSVSDYTLLPELLNRILPELTRRGVSLSLPSLRVDPSTLPVIEAISDVRKTSLTFAVESASETIRLLANKRLNLDEMYDMVERLFSRGWKVIKFYFMLGLPGFREVDEVDDILVFLREVRNRTGRRGEVHVTLSPFVPKPHTPFQAEEMADHDYLVEAIGRVRRGAPRGTQVRFHDANSSRLECVLGRGGEAVARVIEEVYARGARFDSWREYFNWDIWEEALEREMPEWRRVTGNLEGEPPWKVVDSGWEQLRKRQEIEKEKRAIRKPVPASFRWESPINLEELEKAGNDFEKKYRVHSRLLLRFTREGDLRFLSHLDWVEIILRGLRMSEVPVSFSQGYNKRERVSFGFPVPLGVASLSELCEVLCYEDWQVDYVRVNRSLPTGVRLLAAGKETGDESLMGRIGCVEYSLSGGPRISDAINRALKEGKYVKKKTKKGEKEIPLSEVIAWQVQDGESVNLGLLSGTPESVRIDHLLEQLKFGEEGIYPELVKIGQYGWKGDRWHSLDPEP